MKKELIGNLRGMLKKILIPFLVRFLNGNKLPFSFKWLGRPQCSKGNKLFIAKSTILKKTSIIFGGRNCSLIIEEGCSLKGCNFLLLGNGSKIIIGKNTVVNAYPVSPAVINSCEGKTINIGENCLLSNGVEIHNSDYHSIINIKKKELI